MLICHLSSQLKRTIGSTAYSSEIRVNMHLADKSGKFHGLMWDIIDSGQEYCVFTPWELMAVMVCVDHESLLARSLWIMHGVLNILCLDSIMQVYSI